MRIRFLFFVIAVLAAGCRATEASSADTGTIRAFPERPLVTPGQATLHVGDTLRLTVRYPPLLFPPVHPPGWWSSSIPTFATVDSVTGLVTARATGATTIVATLRMDANVKGAMLLQVAP